MADLPFIILPCPNCQVKNRVRSYDSNRIPLCAKCRTPLLSTEENEVHAKYSRSLDDFFDLPDIGLRSEFDE